MTDRKRYLYLMLIITSIMVASFAKAQDDSNLLPKYGLQPKPDWQKQSDKVFLSGMDETYHGDRKRAAADMAMRGWQYLKAGDADDAMRRFNQAWLLNKNNGTALWGMAAIEADKQKYDDSLKLFAEAEKYTGNEMNFSVDYARTMGLVAIANKDDVLLGNALDRYQRIYAKAPQNVRNLKNWAMTLYQKDRYAEAWAKVKLAEALPDKNQLDPQFLAELEERMPRPKD